MLTPRQHEALNVICQAVAAGKPVPSYREIGELLGTRSSGDVHRLVHGLAKRGFLKTTYGQQRSITPLKWPDGRRFSPNDDARVESVIIAYENGRTAARLGQPVAPNPCHGEHATAWRLGHAAGTTESSTYPRLWRRSFPQCGFSGAASSQASPTRRIKSR